MNSKVHSILYSFLFASGAAATGQYYADYTNELCKNTPDQAWGAKFSSITLCCQGALSWVPLNTCEANSAGETPTGTNEWYVDWSLEKCVQDCPVSQNSDCGGLAIASWQTLYATEEACCENTFPGEYKGDCLKPTSSPSVSLSGVPSEVPSESPSSKPSVSLSGVPSEVPSESPSSKPSVSPSDKPSIVPTLSLMPSEAGKYYPDSHNDRCLQEEPCNTGVLPCLPGQSWGPTYLSIQECCQQAVGWVRPEICVANSGGQAFSGTNEWYMDWSLEKCVQDCNDSQNSDCGGFSQNWQTLYATEEACCDASVTGAWRGNCLDASSLSPSASLSDAPSDKPSFIPSTPPSLSPSASGTYLLTCGASGYDTACAGNTAATNTAEEHAVRCCKDSSVDLSSSGWLRGRTIFTPTDPTCTDVWARSEDSDGNCHSALNFWEARAMCADLGGRLCTSEELLADCTRNSGCMGDQIMIWSSTEVVPNAAQPSLSQLPSTFPSLSPSAPGTYLLTCGATKYFKLENGILNEYDSACSGNAPATNTAEEHPVRCCKDSSVDLSSSGWTRGGTKFTPTDQTCTDVWARSKDADGNCQNALNFWEARAMCAEVGGRLCTSEELLADCTRESGCSLDQQKVWSSTVAP